jgi:hypothetical protein
MAPLQGDPYFDIGSSFVPYVGDARDYYEVTSGRDAITGNVIPGWQRTVTVVAAFLPIVSGPALRRLTDLPWFSSGSRQAARAIEAGETSIKVATRDEASEVVWRLYGSQGFLNTTGRTGADVRAILGTKAGTYHWDEAIDAAGRVAGHGVDNVHGALPHVQIHLQNRELLRILFSQ